MAQYVFTMHRLSKVVPPKREILKNISLSFFPGAKIGVLGVNGSGKSTLLKIMAGLDKDIEGEATPMPGLNIGYLPQEPKLDPEHTVRESVEAGMGAVFAAKAQLEAVYTAYGEPDADFDALATEQARLEAIIATAGTDSEHQLEIAADALRLPPWDAKIGVLSGGEKRRVALCSMLLSKPDMLLLDEPTNHLDIESREALVEALIEYSGAVVLVSHDMHLLSLVADRLWLVKGGAVTPFAEDLEAYRRQLLAGDEDAKPAKPVEKPKKASQEDIKLMRSEVKKSEERLDKLNDMRDRLAKKLADAELYEASRIGELETWNKKYGEVMEALDRAEAMWMAAQSKLEAATK